LAVQFYAQDFNNRTPSGAARFWDPTSAATMADSNLRRWHGKRDAVDEAFDATRGPLWDYFQTRQIKRCASFDSEQLDDEPGQGAAFEASAGGYGYNNEYVGRDVRGDTTSMAGSRLPAFASPAETVLFADVAFLRPSLIEYSFVEPPQFLTGPADPSTHFRHDEQANVVWLDGHVSGEAMSFSRSNAYGATVADHEAAGIGWFGPATNALFDRE
jgi:prepilin-type processing-associated H-X9-DG protein